MENYKGKSWTYLKTGVQHLLEKMKSLDRCGGKLVVIHSDELGVSSANLAPRNNSATLLLPGKAFLLLYSHGYSMPSRQAGLSPYITRILSDGHVYTTTKTGFPAHSCHCYSSRFLLLIPICINGNATTGLLLCFLVPPATRFKATALALWQVIIVCRVGDDNFDKSSTDANMIIDRASSISPSSRYRSTLNRPLTFHLLLPSHGQMRWTPVGIGGAVDVSALRQDLVRKPNGSTERG
ncbi:hypothetical protein V8E54_000442 [Elaphomyces granulatus]